MGKAVMKTKETYQPYGKKWKDEMMRLPKIQIIAMFRMVCLERDEANERPRQQKVGLLKNKYATN